MPTVTDVDETPVKQTDSVICPILTQHFVYPFTNNVDPTLIVKSWIETFPCFGHWSTCISAS